MAVCAACGQESPDGFRFCPTTPLPLAAAPAAQEERKIVTVLFADLVGFTATSARLVPFAGWEMPVQYEGVMQEHRAVRTDAGVFDVSHMGELEVEGPRARDLLQGLLSNDLDRIEPGQAQYTLLTNERGGIIDDLIVYVLEPGRFMLVVNASNARTDYQLLREREIRGSDVRDVSDDYALLAVQGPRSIERLGLADASAFTFAEGVVGGVHCIVNR